MPVFGERTAVELQSRVQSVTHLLAEFRTHEQSLETNEEGITEEG